MEIIKLRIAKKITHGIAFDKTILRLPFQPTSDN